MVRYIGGLIGVGFAAVVAWALLWTVVGLAGDSTPKTWTGAPKSAETEFHLHPRDAGLSSEGIFGKFDKQQLQRGFQVYKEVCSACHSLRLVSFRDLEGIGYTPGQVKAIARDWQIEQPSVNPDTGEPATRKNLPSDHFPLVFANDVAARAANNNAIPPDLSYITRARHGGANYIYSLITGYTDQAGFKNEAGTALLSEFPEAKTPGTLHFNPYFANLNIAMPPPLRSDGQVQYQDGTKATVDQMAKDVSAFLTWTADPTLETRHQAGFAAVIFLLLASLLAFGAYRNIWRDIKH
jgi:ubiquinol-cytochrome c reductase cytochrome c1 subunit